VLSFRRARRHAAVFAAVAAVAAVVTAASFAVVGALASAADEGVRLGLASRSGADLALRASIPLTADPATQDEQVRAAIARSFSGLSTQPQVTRTISAELDVRAPSAPGEDRAGLVMSIPDLETRALLESGRWPASADEITMQAAAAEALDVDPGAELTIAGIPVTLVGVWTAADTLDPRWLGDPQVLDGRGSRVGPIVVAESLWPTVPESEPKGQWTIVPDVATTTADDLALIVASWRHVTSEWRGQVDELSAVGKNGGLAITAAALQTRVDGMRAIEPVVLLLILAAALVTLAELARLLAADRSNEIALLWSRGRSAGEGALAGGVEAGVTALIGVVVGAAAGAGVVAATGGDLTALVSPAIAAVPAVLIAASALFGAIASHRASQPDARAGAAESRTRRLAGPGIALLVAAAAAVSVWQLRLYGSPVTPVADGSSTIDPVAVVAPAVALVALVMLGLLVFPPSARLYERLSGRTSVTRMLAARSVARRLPRVAALVVVVAVAAGSVAVAAAYTGTWSATFDRTSALRAGADVAVVGTRGGLGTQQLDALDALPAADAVAPVRTSGMQLSDETGSLVAVSADAFAELATGAGGAIDPAQIAERIRADIASVVVPAGTPQLVLTAEATGFAVAPELSIQLVDHRGRLIRVAADPPSGDGSQLTYRFTLPETVQRESSRVLAVDATLANHAIVVPDSATFAITGWEAGDGSPVADASELFWFPVSTSIDPSPAVPFGGAGFAADSATRSTRLLPGVSGGPIDLDRPTIAVSRALADRYHLEVGDPLSFGAEGSYTRIDAVVVDIIAAVPSAESGLSALVDLTALQRSALEAAEAAPAPTGAWIASGAPEDAAAQAREILPPNTRIRLADDPAGRTVVGATATALSAAALLCGLLAIVTLAAVARAERRSRASDVDVLRALGLSSREQAALRRNEWWWVVGFGGVLGLVAGAIVAALTIPELASAAIPDPYPGLGTALAVDPVTLLVGAALLLLACAAVIEATAAQVARRARTIRERSSR
jgi:hypothetical protein